jgi:glycosyltransferase involved in cell wall biosynthesis
VVLAGLRDYDEMPGAYAACDVLLSTSRVEWGGISRAMLEAKAVGRPVVALDRGDAASVADATVRPAPDLIVSALRSTV